jgi:3-phytase
VGSTPQIPSNPKPTVETATFSAQGDIADDSAIYANPIEPSLSVVIADNKDDTAGGVGVFDMQGQLLQFRQDGKIGNVDLRADFLLAGQRIVLVGANNRSNDTLIFWKLDPQTRQLSAPIGLSNATLSDNYGFCLYHSAKTGKYYAFVTQETGQATLEQYELTDDGGKVLATRVRFFDLGSITEGCVADDELGQLYVAQEDVGIWRYGAEPSAGSARVKIAAVGDGHVAADIEGLALAKGPGNSGYIVASSQQESRFALYDRQTNAFLRNFEIKANGSIDAVQETDGIDICTSNLGPGFEHGALVVHDGQNTGSSTSNLKYVPLVVP